MATLSGVVPSFFLKQIAQAILLRVDGVKGLTNHLEVQSPHCGPGLRKPKEATAVPPGTSDRHAIRAGVGLNQHADGYLLGSGFAIRY
jgi:hypothetical protein